LPEGAGSCVDYNLEIRLTKKFRTENFLEGCLESGLVDLIINTPPDLLRSVASAPKWTWLEHLEITEDFKPMVEGLTKEFFLELYESSC
jgi:hypothetical protein